MRSAPAWSPTQEMELQIDTQEALDANVGGAVGHLHAALHPFVHLGVMGTPEGERD